MTSYQERAVTMSTSSQTRLSFAPSLGLKGKVLVVNDNPHQLQALELVLSQAGYCFCGVEHARSALELIAVEKPDLILSDVVMPDIDGIELCRMIKSSPEIADTPVLLMSGLLYDNVVIEAGLEAGAEDYLEMDAPVSILTNEIERLVKHNRERLARQEAEQRALHLASIVDSSSDAIFGQNAEGLIISWNPAAERMFGYTPEETEGKPIGMLIPDSLGDEEVGILRRIESGEQIQNYWTRRTRKDETPIDVAITISPIKDLEGRLTGYSTIARDVSERKQLEEQLMQSQKMTAMGRMAGGVAHDFNNLLTAILGYCQMTEQFLGENQRAAQYLGEAVKAAKQAASLTNQLLDFSRKQVINPGVTDINDSLKSVEGIVRRLIGDRIELVLAPSTESGPVRISDGQIQQAIINLAVNGRDAMPYGGRLIVETSKVVLDDDYVNRHVQAARGAHVMLAVSDTGIGIDARSLPHIFEPFYTTKGRGKGTGLGLSMVYGIVEQAGGHIDVSSQLGFGTTIRLYFPRIES
ncbi:MAG TPA: PAS domain S-box protein, partial [Blastocatellia bacterium]